MSLPLFDHSCSRCRHPAVAELRGAGRRGGGDVAGEEAVAQPGDDGLDHDDSDGSDERTRVYLRRRSAQANGS